MAHAYRGLKSNSKRTGIDTPHITAYKQAQQFYNVFITRGTKDTHLLWRNATTPHLYLLLALYTSNVFFFLPFSFCSDLSVQVFLCKEHTAGFRSLPPSLVDNTTLKGFGYLGKVDMVYGSGRAVQVV